MGLGGLPTQLMQITLAGGLNQKFDVRALSQPSLDVCLNVEFDELGGLRTRKPYDLSAMPMNILGGGTITNLRRIVPNGNELVLFTDTAVYSWISEASAWALRDTHLAVSSDEEDIFKVEGDQSGCDRAVLNGVELTCFVNGTVYLAARDVATGDIIMAPTGADTTGHGADRARLVAMQTRVMLVWYDTSLSHYRALSIDPANVAASIVLSTSTIAAPGPMDLIAIPGTDTALLAVGTSSTTYTLTKITTALTLTTRSVARGADVMIAIAIDPAVGVIQVARCTSTTATAVVGDRITLSTLVDTAGINQALGSRSSPSAGNCHITCAYRTVLNGGFYRCYVFWTDYEQYLGHTAGALIGFQSYVGWVDTAGTISSGVAFVRDLGIVTRAFDYNGSVYVVGNMSGINLDTLTGSPSLNSAALQNTCFLYRDDAKLVGKANVGRCSGSLISPCLPGVTSSGTSVTWCATVRTAVPSNVFGTAAYTSRAPCNVTFTFDDNRARRCVRMGKTLYITGSIVRQYDGVKLCEVGWLIFPWDITGTAAATGGSLGNGGYTWKATYKSTNAQGEADRSTTAATVSNATGGASGSASIFVKPLYYTQRSLASPLIVLIEVWRTVVNPTADAPFYLITSKDPNSGMPDGYATSDPTVVSTTITDTLSDGSVSGREANPENGSYLESIAPPSCTIIASSDTRVFLAGIAGQPNTVWYSKTRNDGEVVSFNDALTIQVPADGGDVTAISFVNQSLVVFAETAVYVYAGDGFDNLAGGQNFQLVRYISTDCGAVSQEAIANINEGVMFKSSKGWYLLGLDLALQYIGAPVTTYDTDDVYSIDVLTTQHQVRVVTDRRILVLDTLVKQWGEWSEFAIGSTIWNGIHVLCTTTGVTPQRADFTGITYGMDVETAWIKLNDLQGMGRVKKIMPLGEERGAPKLRIRVARDYEISGGGWNYIDDVAWSISPTTIGGPLQVKHGPSKQRCESIKVRLTAVASDGVSAPSNEGIKLTGLALQLGLYNTLNQRLPVAQKD